MQRLLTAAVIVPLLLLAVFRLPGLGFLALLIVIVDWAAVEYVRVARSRAPHAPLWPLPVLIPLLGGGLAYAVAEGGLPVPGPAALLASLALLSLGFGTLVLLARVPLEESLASLGALAFGLPYFAVPLASVYALRQDDPWLMFLLMAIVFLGDTGAYYIGSRWGKHKMAPLISPNKSWEGAAAGFVTSVLAAAVWSVWRLGYLDGGLVAVAALTGIAAQLGDLVESMIKRGAGVKDSGHLLPGHGGMYDRIDAMLFAAPVLLLGLWLVGFEMPAR